MFALGAVLVALALAPADVHPETASTSRCGAAPTPDEILRYLNATRARGAVCHAPEALAAALPLQWNTSLAAVAAAQAQEMAASNQLGHRDRQNRGLPERLGAMGYRFSAAAENVAVGYASLDAVVDAWLGSESHCVNLMNSKVRELGLACSDAGVTAGEDRYWTLVLGAPPRGH